MVPYARFEIWKLHRIRDSSLKSENIGQQIPRVTQFILDVIEASEKNREKAGLPADQNKILKNLNIGKGKAYGFILDFFAYKWGGTYSCRSWIRLVVATQQTKSG